MAKSNSDLKSIQKKLVAAVAMLMVASIMVVSSSYAWFTLSTAPEVTGITTSVGSNGNLEMALRVQQALSTIETATGKTFPEANEYWGNLVDLSDSSYHLADIALQPARLNIEIDPNNSIKGKKQEQAKTTDGELLYWVKEAYEAEYGNVNTIDDLLAAKDETGEEPVAVVTTAETAYPVLVYWATSAQENESSVIFTGSVTTTTGEGTTTVTYEPVYMWYTTADKTATQREETDYGAVEEYKQIAYRFKTGGAYLQTPVYGADGRLSSLSAADVINGIYNADAKGFAQATDATLNFGVRAVGTSSAMTPGQMALLTAKRYVNTAIGNTETSAKNSLKNDAVALADIIVAHYLDSNATYTQADLADVKTAITNLQAIMTELETALKYAVVAVGVSQGQDFDVEDVTISGTEIKVEVGEEGAKTPVTLYWDGKPATDEGGNEVTDDDGNTVYEFEPVDEGKADDDIKAAYAKIATWKTNLSDSMTKANELNEKTSITYDEISGTMTNLLTVNDFTITPKNSNETYTASEMMQQGLMFAGTTMLGGPTVTIENGVYAVIAQFRGNYSTPATMHVEGTFGSLGYLNEDVSVTMKTNVASTDLPNGYHLVYISKGWMPTLSAAEGGTATVVITDIYGYALDFAFRTNAAGSSLLLQTEAANRVDDSSATQGAGSYMEFSTENANFTLKQVGELMNSIRVVFTDDSGAIYGIASMKVEFKDVNVNGDIAEAGDELKIADSNSVFTRTEIDTLTGEETVYEQTIIGAEVTQGGTAIKAPLYLYSFSINDDHSLNMGTAMADQSALMELVQNQAHELTTLVFLDGDTVENSDVAISGNSMTGTMNLQFSSSDSALDPMDYTYQSVNNPGEVEIENGKLTINKIADANETGYDIYANGEKIAEVTAGETATEVDLTKYITKGGKYTISVKATARNYADSEEVTVADTYTYLEPLATPGFVVEEGDTGYTLTITNVTNAAQYKITLDGATSTEIVDGKVAAEEGNVTEVALTLTEGATAIEVTVVAVPAESTTEAPHYYTESAGLTKNLTVE